MLAVAFVDPNVMLIYVGTLVVMRVAVAIDMGVSVTIVRIRATRIVGGVSNCSMMVMVIIVVPFSQNTR
jgi:hypothetical protein